MEQRSIPIPYKRDALVFEEPLLIKAPDEQESQVDDKADTLRIVKELQEKYNTASTYQIIIRGNDDIYKFWSDSIRLITETGISNDLLLSLLISHLIEKLVYSEVILLLNYLETDVDDMLQPGLKEKIQNYFKGIYLKNSKATGLLVINIEEKSGRTLLIRKQERDKMIWSPAQFQDQQDLLVEIKGLIRKMEIYKKTLNNQIGFIINFKKDNYMVFKTKDLLKKRNKGARCDQTPKNVAEKLLRVINPDIFNIQKVKSTQMCVLQELYLRLFNIDQKEGKIWFLTPIEAQILDIENI
jgi:hypothetical protein